MAYEGKLQQQQNYSYAGFWKRFAAILLDIIFTIIIFMLIGFALGVSGLMTNYRPAEGNAEYIGQLLYVAFIIIYYPLMESSSKQGSLGKIALGIKIINSNGSKMSFLKAVARYLSKIISGLILGIGYIMVAFNSKKRGLHDIICDTYVINK